MPTVPTQKQDDVEPVISTPQEEKESEACWNCQKPLDSKGVCAACGFDKEKLENDVINSKRSQAARIRMVKEGIL